MAPKLKPSLTKSKFHRPQKFKSLSIEDIIKVLDSADAGFSRLQICKEFQIKTNTFYDIMSNRDQLRSYALSLSSQTKDNQDKTISGTYEELESLVLKWYTKQCSAGIAVCDTDIQNAGERFAMRLNIKEFKANDEWLFKFRSRHCLGETLITDNLSIIDEFRHKLNGLIQENGLLLNRVYSADAANLFWNAMPVNTQAVNEEDSLLGRRIYQERLSVLLCANADGSHRLKPMVVGKAKTPHALKNIKKILPVLYKGSPSALLTRELILFWFHKLCVPEIIRHQTENLEMDLDKVEAVILLDNTRAYPPIEKLTSKDGKIRAIPFPPNTATAIQPLNKGVIKCFKRYYRYFQMNSCFLSLETIDREEETRRARISKRIKSYNMRNAVFNISDAWKQVNEITLSKAWNKLLHDTDVKVDFDGFEPKDFVQIAYRGGEENLLEKDVLTWLESDIDNERYDHEGHERGVLGGYDNSEENTRTEMNLQQSNMNLSPIRDCCGTLLSFIESSDDPDIQDYYSKIREFRSVIIKKQQNLIRQNEAHDFSKPIKQPRGHLSLNSSSDYASLTNLPYSSHTTESTPFSPEGKIEKCSTTSIVCAKAEPDEIYIKEENIEASNPVIPDEIYVKEEHIEPSNPDIEEVICGMDVDHIKAEDDTLEDPFLEVSEEEPL